MLKFCQVDGPRTKYVAILKLQRILKNAIFSLKLLR